MPDETYILVGMQDTSRESCMIESHSIFLLSFRLILEDSRVVPTSESNSTRRGLAAAVRVHVKYTGGICLGAL